MTNEKRRGAVRLEEGLGVGRWELGAPIVPTTTISFSFGFLVFLSPALTAYVNYQLPYR